MALKRRNKKKMPRITCRYCVEFWRSVSRSKGRGTASTVYRACRVKGEEVTGDTEICEDFNLSDNIHCEKFSNRMAHICCLGRRQHQYGDDYCKKKCPQVAIIKSSYRAMGLDVPVPKKPNIGRISAFKDQSGADVETTTPQTNKRLKRRVKSERKESTPSVKKIKRKKKDVSKPVVRKLKRRRKR